MNHQLTRYRANWHKVTSYFLCSTALAMSLALISACSTHNQSESPYFVSSPIASETDNSKAKSSQDDSNGDQIEAQILNNTTWQLVRIQSMDDTSYSPKDNEKYSLAFLPQGVFSGQADCNRIRGQWLSPGKQQLTLDNIIATRAMCPPDSLHDRFIRDLNHIRSYVLRDGHLFLATQADGAILEFSPLSNE